ncbi:MAG TPA: polysaccharide biosynthesis protein [Ruminococcaceae bacterium]|nr:polysaccharide biosynthesis protein [Oscillospiraceae bacterium]HCT16841.1 polysaccharide biosynthesis protein [Oscillospiraceae bacterium]
MADGKSGVKSQSLLSGAFILVVATVLVKVIGALFKIPLSMLIGEVGRGYFSTAYEIYTPLYSISMAGLPVAVSRLVAKERSLGHFRDVRMIRRVSARLFVMMGAIGTVLLLLIAYPYTRFIVKYVENVYCVLAIAPSIFFCCCMSTYRGYYEGLQNMLPTAVSEVIEVIGKLIVGLGASYALLKAELAKFEAGQPVFGAVRATKEDALAAIYPFAATTAVLGVTSGTILGLIYLILRHKIKGDGITKAELLASPKPASGSSLAKIIVMTALPIAASSLVTNITNLIDAATIQARLKYAVEKAPDVIYALYGTEFETMKVADSQIVKYIYGIYNEVLDFKNLIPTITMTLGISAIPVLSAAWANQQTHSIKVAVESVIRVTMLISLPTGFGLAAVSYSLLDTFYPAATASIGATILAVYGCTMFVFAVSSPITSMLQGLGRTDIPLKSLVVGAVIKIVLNYILIGNPHININGAPIASIACYLVVVLINLYSIIKITGVRINFGSVFIKPCICSGISAVVAFLTNLVFGKFLGNIGNPDSVMNGNTIALIIAVIAAVIAYVITILLFKGISKDDLLMIPKGEKIAETLEKRGFLG